VSSKNKSAMKENQVEEWNESDYFQDYNFSSSATADRRFIPVLASNRISIMI